MIWKLSLVMPKKNLKMMAEGIFFSLLNYCIEVYGNVWGLATYDDQTRKSTGFIIDDNAKLQILVNKVLRSLTGLDFDTPVAVLHATSGQLSVQKRTTMFTLVSVYKSIQKKQPVYNYSRLQPNPAPVNVRTQGQPRIDYELSISRGSFYFRGSKLYSQLPANLTQEVNQSAFKKGAKKWISENIPLQPP